MKRAIEFMRYLLSLEQQDKHRSVVIFAHSQGAIIVEHVLEQLNPEECKKLRVFTFGGGSYIAPGVCHPDSHNFANIMDPVCRIGSSSKQALALERYYGRKRGLSDWQICDELAYREAILMLDSVSPRVIEEYVKQGTKKFEREMKGLQNITILDVNPKVGTPHEFTNYQEAVRIAIKKCFTEAHVKRLPLQKSEFYV